MRPSSVSAISLARRPRNLVHILGLIGQGLRDFVGAAAKQVIDLIGLDRQRLRDFRRACAKH